MEFKTDFHKEGYPICGKSKIIKKTGRGVAENPNFMICLEWFGAKSGKNRSVTDYSIYFTNPGMMNIQMTPA
jgi:hypothetical protein